MKTMQFNSECEYGPFGTTVYNDGLVTRDKCKRLPVSSTRCMAGRDDFSRPQQGNLRLNTLCGKRRGRKPIRIPIHDECVGGIAWGTEESAA